MVVTEVVSGESVVDCVSPVVLGVSPVMELELELELELVSPPNAATMLA